MAIADTITSMQNHTSNAYTMIGYGTDLTGINKNLENLYTSIFNAFLESLRTPDTLFTNLPKKSGTGTNIMLNDTANAPMRIELGASEISQAGTPTPSSPQDIHTISGSNKVVVSDGNGNSQEADIDLGVENLWKKIPNGTKNGVTLFYNTDDGSYTLDGTSTSPTSFYISASLPIGKYTLSANNEQIITGGADYLLLETQGGTSTNKTLVFSNANNKATFDVTSPITTLVVVVSSGKTYNNFKFYPMLEKGETSHKYCKYGETPIEYCKIGNYEDKFIRTSGKNLFDKNSVENDKRLDGSGQPISSSATGFSLTGYIKVKPNTQYTYSRNLTSSSYYVNVGEYTSDKTFIERLYKAGETTTTFTFTTPNNCEYLRINDATTNLNSIQLELGDRDTPYEPYGTNEWYIKKNIGKVVYTGANSESWAQSTSGGLIRYASPIINDAINLTSRSALLSNYFHFLSVGNEVGQGFIYARQFFAYPTQDLDTAEKFKTWLTTHNTEVYYPLATPTYTQITGTLAEQLENVYQKMLSYSGQTNINQVNNDLSFNLSVQAIEDLN